MLNFFGKSKNGKKKRKYDDDYDEEYDEEYDDDDYDDDDYDYDDDDDDYDDDDDDYDDDDYDDDDDDDYEEYDDDDDDDDDDDYEEEPPVFKPKKKKNKAKKPISRKPMPRKPKASFVDDDELKELQEENEQMRADIRNFKAELRKNNRQMNKLQAEVDDLRQVNQELENDLATTQAVPKDYDSRMSELQQVKSQYNNLLRENNRQLDELDLNRKKAERFSNKIKQYEQELLAKQEEIDKLSEERIVIMGSDTTEVDNATYEELAHLRQELETAKRRLAQQEVESGTQLSNEDIGEVLLEAKRQAKEIVNQANHRAQLVSDETKRKAGFLKRLEKAEQEYNNYYKRIKDVKEESEQAFNQIIDLVKEDTYEDTDKF